MFSPPGGLSLYRGWRTKAFPSSKKEGGGPAAEGMALLAASACTRFGVFHAGIESAKDPRYTISPQKRRLAARRAAGITDDSITTGY